jgi:hypothetical protein
MIGQLILRDAPLILDAQPDMSCERVQITRVVYIRLTPNAYLSHPAAVQG